MGCIAARVNSNNASQRGGTLENSREMIGWELRELRLRVTKIRISKSSQMGNKTNPEKITGKKITLRK